MDMQRFIELDEMLDEVIALRGRRLAEEIHFANPAEPTRSIARDVGLTGGGAVVGTAGTLGLVHAGRKSSEAAAEKTNRQKKKAANKARHARDTRRNKNKSAFDTVTKRLMTRGKRG